MAKDTIIVTSDWQQIASGQVTITVTGTADGALFFNEVASATDAYTDNPSINDQYLQDAAVPTFVRANQDGYQLVVDGVL